MHGARGELLNERRELRYLSTREAQLSVCAAKGHFCGGGGSAT